MNQVRYAKREDLEVVNTLRLQVNDVHVKGRGDIFKKGFSEGLDESFFQILESNETDILVYEKDQIVVGYLLVKYIDRKETQYTLPRKYCHIEEFCVNSQYQRQGIGRELLLFAKEEAKKKGFSKIELDVWEFNQDAIRFYEELGFTCYRRLYEITL